MSQGPLCPNLTQKVQKEVSQMVNHNFSLMILLGGLSVNLNHLKTFKQNWKKCYSRKKIFYMKKSKSSCINLRET